MVAPAEASADDSRDPVREFVICSNQKSFFVRAESVALRDEWLSHFKPALAAAHARSGYDSTFAAATLQLHRLSAGFPSAALSLLSLDLALTLPPPPLTTRAESKIAARWKSDKTAKKCVRCNAAFILIRRPKHHCRMCGEVVCGACSRRTLLIAHIDQKKPQRVCDVCFDSKDAAKDGDK